MLTLHVYLGKMYTSWIRSAFISGVMHTCASVVIVWDAHSMLTVNTCNNMHNSTLRFINIYGSDAFACHPLLGAVQVVNRPIELVVLMQICECASVIPYNMEPQFHDKRCAFLGRSSAFK